MKNFITRFFRPYVNSDYKLYYKAIANKSCKIAITGENKQVVEIYVNGTIKTKWILPHSASSFSVKEGDMVMLKSKQEFDVTTHENLEPIE